MQHYNLILVFSSSFEKVLMLKRTKEPYLHLLNFPGGKVEQGEEHLQAAQRELKEETGLDLPLKALATFTYPLEPCVLHIFFAKTDNLEVTEELHPLFWISVEENFASEKFAGLGNCEHLVRLALFYKEKLENETFFL